MKTLTALNVPHEQNLQYPLIQKLSLNQQQLMRKLNPSLIQSLPLVR